jgi:predicted double-glycine peptidase
VGRGFLGTGLLLLPTYPDAAEMRLNNGTEGSYSIHVRSWAEIPFRTVVRQQFDFSCGSAAVATLLSYHYGRPTPEAQVFTAMWAKGDQTAIRKAGFSMLDIKNYLDSIGYRTEGFRLTAAQLRQAARPGLVILNLKGYKHFVVVKGVANDQVLVGDPMLGLSRYSLADFQSRWNGIFLAVVASPLKSRPDFNLASEWVPWATAPLETAAYAVPITKLTNYLPPLYQITPQIIVDPRNPGGK